MARKVAEEASPDSVIVSRRGIRLGWSGLGVEAATKMGEMAGPGKEDLEAAENIKEGLKSFVGKRKPKWVDSKL